MNMGSYNYLGFAQNSGRCADAAVQAVTQRGIAVSSSRHELGKIVVSHQYGGSHVGLEQVSK